MVDLSSSLCESLPEGKPPFSDGFPMVFPLKPPFSYGKSPLQLRDLTFDVFAGSDTSVQDTHGIPSKVMGYLWQLMGYDMGMGQNPIPLVNIKIAGKWMFIPLKMVCIGIDP